MENVIPLLLPLAIVAFSIIAMWKVFEKAGRPGWASLIPIYNTVVALDMVGMSLLNIVGMFIPIVNIIVAINFSVNLAKAFGKSTGFALGLLFLAPIFWGILAFGDARYELEDYAIINRQNESE